MLRHGAGCVVRLPVEEGLYNREMLDGFLGQTVIVVAGAVVLPGHVAEGPEEDLEAGDFLGEKDIAAGGGDQIVQPAIDRPRLLDEGRAGRGLERHQSFEIGGESVQLGQVDLSTGAASGGTFQDTADGADLADIAGADPANDGSAIGQEIDDTDAGQGDESLANGSVADAEALGQLLRDQVRPGPQSALEDIGEQGLDNGLAAQAVMTVQCSSIV